MKWKLYPRLGFSPNSVYLVYLFIMQIRAPSRKKTHTISTHTHSPTAKPHPHIHTHTYTPTHKHTHKNNCTHTCPYTCLHMHANVCEFSGQDPLDRFHNCLARLGYILRLEKAIWIIHGRSENKVARLDDKNISGWSETLMKEKKRKRRWNEKNSLWSFFDRFSSKPKKKMAADWWRWNQTRCHSKFRAAHEAVI